jgi:hypothetical protein
MAPFQHPLGSILKLSVTLLNFSIWFSYFPCFFASNFKENPHTTESTPIENKYPFAPWPSVDPKREFAAGNLNGTKIRQVVPQISNF